MNRSRILRQALCMFFLSMLCTVSWSEELSDEVKKEINRSFQAVGGDMLAVDNRFGNITIEHWNRNEVKIQVKIESKANSLKLAQQNMDKISVEIDKSGNRISAVTSMNIQNQNNDTRVRVDYVILLPSSLALDLRQEFGNITLPDGHKGKCTFGVKFGKLSGESLSAPVSINSQFSDVSLGNLTSVSLDAKHCGEVLLGNLGTLHAEIQFSNLKTGSIESFNLEEKHSDAFLESVVTGTINSQHSKLKIGLVQTSLSVETLSHGNLEIKELHSKFRSLNANASFGGVTIYMRPQTSFSLDASASFGQIDLQDVFKQRNRDYVKENNKQWLKADINNGGSKIVFNGSFSTIAIKGL